MHKKILIGTWAVACQSMSVFTLLPAIKTENVNMMYVLAAAIPRRAQLMYVLIQLLTA